MAFEDALEDMAGKVRDYADNLTTEEATKTAIIMPFISRVLGYDGSTLRRSFRSTSQTSV